MMTFFWGDIRFAFRQLRQSKAFTITSILTLALGISATTAIFSLVNSVLLKPLAFPQSDRLVSLDTLERPHGSNGPAIIPSDTSYPNFFDWRQSAKSFESMASYGTTGLTIPANGETQAQRVSATVVSAGFFRTLKTRPLLGRDFTRDDEKPGTRTVILSYNLWRQQYASAPDVVGRILSIGEEPYTVVGVAPKGFYFPINAPDIALYVIFSKLAQDSGRENRGWNQLSVVGRLKPNATAASAKAELNTIQSNLAAHYQEDSNETAVRLTPLLEDFVGNFQKPLSVLLCAVACLLLIACANVAGLTLTRANARRSEFAMRAALGASRAQMLRQLLIESVLLSLGSGLLGVFLTWNVLQLSSRFLPDIPRLDGLSMDPTVLAFAVAVSLLTGILFGLAPAWQTSGLDPADVLHDNVRSITANRGQNRLHASLVVAETAGSLVLLIGAGLLIRSFSRTMDANPGFRPDHLLTFRVPMPDKRYTAAKRLAFYRDLFAKLEATPGVQSVSGAFPMPLINGDITITFTAEDYANKPGDEPSERLTCAAPKFFETLGIPLLRGRYFTVSDEAADAKPVIIVNRAFARKYFGTENVLGKYVKPDISADERNQKPRRTIIGVVGNVKRAKLTEAERPEYYLANGQVPFAPLTIAMRIHGDPARYENRVLRTVRDLDGALPVWQARPYSDSLMRSLAQERFRAGLVTIFAGLALLLSAVGLYGLLSYMVGQRRSELGLRMALGAQPGNVLRLVLRRGLYLTIAGLVFGIGLAVVLTRFLSGLLFGVEPVDLLTYSATATVLLAVALGASLLPAWRASKLDPIQTLRQL